MIKKLFLVAIFLSVIRAQILYEEHFTNGQTNLQWGGFFLGTDTIVPYYDSSTPENDNWVGRLYTDQTFALSFAGDPSQLINYSIEAYVYTLVSPGTSQGPFNGLVFRLNPVTNGFYVFASDFDNDRRLRLSYHEPPNFQAQTIRVWTSAEIPGGVPTQSSWHHFAVNVFGDSIFVFYDNHLLQGCPFVDSRSTFGYFGIYAVSLAGIAETRVDRIIVRSVPYTASETKGFSSESSSLQVNSALVRGAYLVVKGESLKDNELEVYDAMGRLILRLQPDGKKVRSIDFSHYSSGVYLIKCGTEKVKFIKASYRAF